jgi:hypothetical protein
MRATVTGGTRTTTSAPAQPFRQALAPGRPFSGAPSDATCAVMPNRHQPRTRRSRQRPPSRPPGGAVFLFRPLGTLPRRVRHAQRTSRAVRAQQSLLDRHERLERKCEILVEMSNGCRHAGLGLRRLSQIPSLHLKNIDIHQIFSWIWHRTRNEKLRSSGVARHGKAMLNMRFRAEGSRHSSSASMNSMLSTLSPLPSASCW